MYTKKQRVKRKLGETDRMGVRGRVKEIENKTRCSTVSFIHSTLSNRQRQNCVLFMSINMQFGVCLFSVFVVVVVVAHSKFQYSAVCLMLLKTTITIFYIPKSMYKR